MRSDEALEKSAQGWQPHGVIHPWLPLAAPAEPQAGLCRAREGEWAVRGDG